MPPFEKSPVALIEMFNKTMVEFPQAIMRKTFGYPCAYVNGHVAVGLFTGSFFLHLSPVDEAEFLKLYEAMSLAPMTNRPMKGYVVTPPRLLGDTQRLGSWIVRLLEFVSTLPLKEKKAAPKKRG